MIFVDTSAWLAVSDVRDQLHVAALRAHRELLSGQHGRLITSDFVLDETLTLLRKRTGGDLVGRFVEGLDASRSVQMIWVTQAQFIAARELFLDQGPTSWSLTDCTSFVLMRELGIELAFTFDEDFRRAGFELRPSPES